MEPKRIGATVQSLVAALRPVLIAPGDTLAYASQQSFTPAPPQLTTAAKISPEQLDSLVAPIALYPDPLMLAQVLAASFFNNFTKQPGGREDACRCS
jgi:hypothetical protein